MKFVNLLLTILITFILNLAISSCGFLDKDDENDIEGVPSQVNNFLDSNDIEELENAGMEIHKGADPPNIEGSYELNSLIITYDQVGMEGYTVAYYEIRYYDQKSDGTIKMDYESSQAGDYGYGVGAFISGDDNNYTVYIEAEGSITNCDYKMPSIHSGTKSASDDINDFYWGLIMTEKEGTNCDQLMPEDAVRIIKESDGTASEISTKAASINQKNDNNPSFRSIISTE